MTLITTGAVMVHYLHHVPGRLRVRSTTIKRDERMARRVYETLSALQGVNNVEVSTVTGSIKITYDLHYIDHEDLLDHLRGHNIVQPGGGAAQTQTDMISESGRIATRLVGGFVLEKIIERSALALIGAIA
jgi:copper chaperone CopZ